MKGPRASHLSGSVAESCVALGIDADNSRKLFDPIFERAKDEEWPAYYCTLREAFIAEGTNPKCLRNVRMKWLRLLKPAV
jgi:hypothetical protein